MFSSKFDIKTSTNKDQIRAKMRSNIVATTIYKFSKTNILYTIFIIINVVHDTFSWVGLILL